MLKSLSILYLVGFFHLINGDGLRLGGRCPDVKPVETLDIDRYMGTWYQYSKYTNVYDVSGTCQKDIFKNNGDCTLSVEIFPGQGEKVGVKAEAEIIEDGKLQFSTKEATPIGPNYYILGTDYDNYSVVYNCINRGPNEHVRFAWIFTRSYQPSAEVIDAAKSVLTEKHLSTRDLVRVRLTDCANGDSVDNVA